MDINVRDISLRIEWELKVTSNSYICTSAVCVVAKVTLHLIKQENVKTNFQQFPAKKVKLNHDFTL